MNQTARRAWAATALAAALAACNQGAPEGEGATATEIEAREAGYLAPPQVEAVEPTADRLVLRGSAPPGDQVRITAASGGGFTATADDRGRWEAQVPREASPQMFGLVAERQGRVLEAEGRLLVLPGGPTLMLRPGHGALPVGRAPDGPPRIISLDLASDGAAAVSGYAQPSTRAVTVVDGTPPAEGVVVGQGATDAEGRFAIILATPLTEGEHSVVVNTPDGVARAAVRVLPAADPGQRPFVAARQADGWRVTWRLPRGGLQTTYVPERPA